MTVNKNKNQAYLRVQLISGKELAAKDLNGLSDPFVVLKIGDFRTVSKVQNKTLNPEWNQVFDIKPDLNKVPSTLRLVVWDKDAFSKDYMGEVKIELLELFHSNSQSEFNPILYEEVEKNDNIDKEWFILTKRNEAEVVKGSLRFKIGWIMENETQKESLKKLYEILFQSSSISSLTLHPTSPALTPTFDRSGSPVNYSTITPSNGILTIDIKSATDLPYDSALGGISFDMDPFVVVSLGKTSFKTSTKKHTLNPTWNERVVFQIDESNFNSGWIVKFSIYDYDKFSNNDFIGTCSIPLIQLLYSAAIEEELPESAKELQSRVKLEDDVPCGPIGTVPKVPDEINIMGPSPVQDDKDPKDLPDVNSTSSTLIQGDGNAEKVKKEGKDNMINYNLKLKLENKKWTQFNSKILVAAKFRTNSQIRAKFWSLLCRTYDSDNNGMIDRSEITALLESLESTLNDETIDNFFIENGEDPQTGEIEIGHLVLSLEKFYSNLDTKSKTEEEERVICINQCPFCNEKLDSHDKLAVLHMSTCVSAKGKDEQIHRIIMGDFITETRAKKKWITKISEKISHGNFKVGENNANILVQNRTTGVVEEEKMPTYIRVGIRLLYKAGKGGAVEYNSIKNVFKTMSTKQGIKFEHPSSKNDIEPFIQFHQLNREEILDPIESFENFNQFFYRKLKPGERPVASLDLKVGVSPADCRCMVFPTVDIAKELWVKGNQFSIKKLFNNTLSEAQIKKLDKGSMGIFRLAPQDYHRFHIPVDGILGKITKVEGQYYTVNPMAIRSALDVYGENVRVLTSVESPDFGTVYIACIGAMMVGSIIITNKEGDKVSRGDELGFFAFGGSTILLFFEEGEIEFDKDLVDNSKEKMETLVKF